MDDIKLFAKNEKELEIVTHVVKIYSQDIGMDFQIRGAYDKFPVLFRRDS